MRMMRFPVLFSIALGLLVALPADAVVFTVKLKNGGLIETRYQPAVADWDESKILLVTAVGNRISLSLGDVDTITVDTEVKGFGTVIDTTTIIIGIAPNDRSVPGRQGDVDPATELRNYMRQRDSRPPPPPFTVQQFAEPNSMGGIPLGFVNTVTPPLAGGTVMEPPVAR